MRNLRRMLHDIQGATAIEYAIIAGLISIVAVVAIGSIGSSLNSTFANVANAF